MEEKPRPSPPTRPHGDKLQPERPHRWTEKGDDRSPKHQGPQPEGNGGTGAPASFPPHP